jgi:hypothetical protein
MFTDKIILSILSMLNPTQSGSLIDVDGKMGFGPTEKEAGPVYRWLQNKQRHWSWDVWVRHSVPASRHV